MLDAQPSRTAEYVAFYRALESAAPRERRLFEDSFALQFLRPALRRAIALSRVPLVGRLIPCYADRRMPGARTSAIARTRLIDDMLLKAVAGGAEQVVILGAGFDCRAYRLRALGSLPVFEVDHPATLASKLDRLRRLMPALPPHVRFVGIDFDRQPLALALQSAGFDAGR